MEAQDLLAALERRQLDHHLPVEAAGPEERRVQRVGAVRRGDDDDALVGVEAVHLDQHGVQRLLVRVVAADRARAGALLADGVYLVDEDYARCALFRLAEDVAHAARADADEHLLEVAAAHREEGHPGLAGDGPRQQRLACAGRAYEEYALGDAPAEPLERPRVLQELDYLLYLLSRLVDARDVREGDLPALVLLAGEDLGL